jgi:hypothetical protein
MGRSGTARPLTATEFELSKTRSPRIELDLLLRVWQALHESAPVDVVPRG